jgi:nucleotide-binding universal stress UspA family protein
MKIILAVDGSKHSDWATDLLLKLPLAKEPEIRVLSVVDLSTLGYPFIPAPHATPYAKAIQEEITKALAAAKHLAAGIADRLGRRWIKVRPVVRKGHVAQTIISTAKDEEADLIILGSRGLSKIRSLLMGSISQKVALYAPCSVLVVKKRGRGVKNVLIALDGSEYSDAVAGFLHSEFQPERLHGTALFAWAYPLPLYLPKMAAADIQEQLNEMMKKTGLKARPLFVLGHPVKEIVETARKKRVDLVVVGSRGMTGLKRFLLGGVSYHVVQYSPASVLIVRRP